MTDNELVARISEQRARGMSDEAIRAALVKEHRELPDITGAFARLELETNPRVVLGRQHEASMMPVSARSGFDWMFLLGVIVLAAGIYVFYAYGESIRARSTSALATWLGTSTPTLTTFIPFTPRVSPETVYENPSIEPRTQTTSNVSSPTPSAPTASPSVTITPPVVTSGGVELAPPQVTVSVSAIKVVIGTPVTITWSASNATSCRASTGFSTRSEISGSTEVKPTLSTSYTITCKGDGGTAKGSAFVTVVPEGTSVPAPTPSPTPTPTPTASPTPTPTPSPSGPVVTSSGALYDQIKSAHTGDTILVAPGTYSALNLRAVTFSGSGITIRSSDPSHPAVLSGLVLDLITGMTFDSIEFVAAGGGTVVVVGNSSNIHFKNVDIHSTDVRAGSGMLLRSSTNVSVTNSHVHNLGFGIGHLSTTGLVVSHNVIDHIQTDGVSGGGSTDAVVDGNVISSFYPLSGDHPDGIQFYGGDRSTRITNNTIYRGEGSGIPMQGIFLERVTDVTITGNAMAGTLYNGIALSEIATARVSDNFVQGYPDYATRIIVRGASSNVTLTNNVAQQVSNYEDKGPNPGYSESGTTIIPAAPLGSVSDINAWLSSHGRSTVAVIPLSGTSQQLAAVQESGVGSLLETCRALFGALGDWLRTLW